MTINIFEVASRNKIRFNSNKGLLTVEDVWTLPLTSKTGFDLDSIARNTNNELKAIGEESFVNSSINHEKAVLELKMDVIKYVISFKLKEYADKLVAMGNVDKKLQLMDILAKKQTEALGTLTEAELKEQIKALG